MHRLQMGHARRPGGHKVATGFDPERGRWLKALREAAGLTQEQAFLNSGVKLDVIVKAEAGRDIRASKLLPLLLNYGVLHAPVGTLPTTMRPRPLLGAPGEGKRGTA